MYVPWEITDTWQFYGIARTPDISWLVNRIIEQEGWEPGNSMSFIMKDWGAALAKHRRVFAYERSGPEYATRLYIKYTVPPPYTFSRYWTTLLPDKSTYDRYSLFMQGCLDAYKFSSSYLTVVLDFGYPFINNDRTEASTWPRVDAIELPIEDIQPAVQAFIQGFYTCSLDYVPYYQHLSLVVGTNNNGELAYINKIDDARFHGQEWGRLVDRINQWLDSDLCAIYPYYEDECTYRSRVTVLGGMDVEPWVLNDGTEAPPETVHAWLDGYQSETNQPFINYGDCSYCYPSNPDSLWDQDDALIFSWDTPQAFPLPLIYTYPLPGLPASTLAEQWQSLSEYSISMDLGRIIFWGSMTSCQEERYGGVCKEGYLDPVEGWSQLFWTLYQGGEENTRLRPSLFNYSTDFIWENYEIVPTPDFG